MMKDILIARENRWLYTNELVDKFRLPIITITLNIPGKEKCKKDYMEAHKNITKDFIKCLNDKELPILYFENRVDWDGPESFIIVDSNERNLKEIAVEFEENHLLGRIADIDIKGKEKESWSRKELGVAERKCLVCTNPARRCIISNRHSLEEILNSIAQIISSYNDVGDKK